MKKLLLLLSAVGMIFTACEGGLDNEENGGTPSTPKIELSQQSVEVEFEPAEYEVAVTSPYSWEATTKNDWIVVDSETGIAGTKTLKFSVARNEEEDIREGTIVVKNEDYNLVAELYITQKAFVPEWTIETETLTFAVEGGTQEIAITANFEYAYSANVDWLTIEKSEKGVSVTVPNYVEVDERTAEITISNEKYGISKVVKATQGAFVPEITFSLKSLTFDYKGGAQEVAITANFEYEYSTNVDWLTIEKSEKGINISATQNTKFEEYSAEITISNEKYNISETISVVQNGVSAEPENVIIYTSSNGKIVTPYNSNVFSANIVSNIYSNVHRQGIIIFDAPVTSIGYEAFRDCSSLTRVTIPNSVTSIGIYAFEGCRSLTSVTIPDSVTSIGGAAFYECSSLTSVYISDLSAWCKIDFGNDLANPLCYAKKLYLNGTEVTELTIPSDITSIRDLAFWDCTSLTSVTIPDSVTSIGDGAFYCCYNLTSVTIPDSVTSIGNSAFYGCTSLTSITIPDSVTSIGHSTFYKCSSLTSVTIPDSVTSIEAWTFGYCHSLTSVTIPNSVTSIGGSAFYGCSSLTSVYCKPTIPPTGGYEMFYFNASGRKIYVPRNSVEAYKSADYWSNYKSYIEGYDF